VLVAHAGGESEKGHAVIAVDVDAHVAAETLGIPRMMVALHVPTINGRLKN
jgi:hypothetical protein